jgi:hypothetical protein
MTHPLHALPLQNAAERARMLLMAPIAFARCCLFWSSIICYGTLLLCAVLIHLSSSLLRTAHA